MADNNQKLVVKIPMSRSIVENMTEAELAAELGPMAATAAKRLVATHG